MADRNDRLLDKKSMPNENFIGELLKNLRLVFRLMKDRRVNFLLKFLPIGALVYLVYPLDFLPVNPLDDAVVIWVGASLFIELCPDDVVQEHRDALNQRGDSNASVSKPAARVVDAEFKDLPKDER